MNPGNNLGMRVHKAVAFGIVSVVILLAVFVVSATAETIDEFNRTNNPLLGTAYNTFNWNEQETNGQCTFAISNSDMLFTREVRSGEASIALGARVRGNSSFTTLITQTAGGDGNVITLFSNSTLAFQLQWATPDCFAIGNGDSAGTCLFSPVDKWAYNITLKLNTTNSSIEGFFNGTKQFNVPMITPVDYVDRMGVVCSGETDNVQTYQARIHSLFYDNFTAQVIVPPILNVTEPLNNSVYNKSEENLTFQSYCFDMAGGNFSLQMRNSSGVVASTHNTTFDAGLSLLNGFFDLRNISTGEYSLNFTCKNVLYSTMVEVVSNVTQTEINIPAINITHYYPLTSSNVSLLAVPFNLSVNLTSDCSLFINETNYGIANIASGGIRNHSIQTIFNGTFTYKYDCNISGFHVNSTPMLFTILEPYLSNPPATSSNQTTINVSTDLNPLVSAFVAFLALLLAFGVIILGKYLKSGLTGIIGCFILFFASFLFAVYSNLITYCLILLALLLMYFFIQNGSKNNL